MDSDLIVLPRAAVEKVRAKVSFLDRWVDEAHKVKHGATGAVSDLDSLLAAAKPVVDEAVTHAVTFSSRPDAQRFVETQALWEVPARGTYRMLLIAADAAEEG